MVTTKPGGTGRPDAHQLTEVGRLAAGRLQVVPTEGGQPGHPLRTGVPGRHVDLLGHHVVRIYAPVGSVETEPTRSAGEDQRYSSIAFSSTDFGLAPLNALTSSPPT